MQFNSRSALLVLLLAMGVGESPVLAKLKHTNASKKPGGASAATNLGKPAIDILSHPTRVEVLRLKRAESKDQANLVGRNPEEKFTITATGKEQGTEFAAKLKELVLDEGTTRSSHMGVFQADVAFRAWKNDESVTAIVNFGGSSFLLLVRDGAGKLVKSVEGGLLFNKNGKFDNGELFEKAKSLAIAAFPEDKALQEVPNIAAIFEAGEPYELLSLNPKQVNRLPEAKRPKPEETFHGYKILGRMNVEDAAARKQLVTAYKRAIEEGEAAAAGCFNPRHGIRLKQKDRVTDLVICFECIFTMTYNGENYAGGFRHSGNASVVFNNVLKKAGVPLPKKGEE